MKNPLAFHVLILVPSFIISIISIIVLGDYFNISTNCSAPNIISLPIWLILNMISLFIIHGIVLLYYYLTESFKIFNILVVSLIILFMLWNIMGIINLIMISSCIIKLWIVVLIFIVYNWTILVIGLIINNKTQENPLDSIL